MNKNSDDRRLQLLFRRFEFKYRLSWSKAEQVRNYLPRFLEPDSYCQPAGSYRVTSLYYDSPAYKCYFENEAGLPHRFKVRRRYYNSEQNNSFMELKRKDYNIVTKSRYLLQSPVKDTAAEIKRLSEIFHLRPVVWVSYQREAWVQRRANLRVTLDSDLKFNYASGSSYWQDCHSVKELGVILEVKFNGRIPFLIQRMLQELSLSRDSISKYRLAVEASSVLRYSPWTAY